MTNLHIGADTYRMDVFPLPATEETNPMPLDVCVSSTKLWLSCEFDRRIYSVPLDAADGTAMSAVEIPDPPATMFRTLVFGDAPSRMSMMEDIDCDAQGNVWLAQTGHQVYGGVETNLGRALKYSPATGAWSAFPLPHNNPAMTSVLVDGPRLWAAAGSPSAGSALLATRPASWRREQTDPTVFPVAYQPGEFGGWTTTALDQSWAAHMAIGTDGRLFVTNYWGNSVTAINRTTLAVQTYPLPAGHTGPWQIGFDLGGGCWVTCDSSRALCKLNPATGTWTAYPTGLAAPECLHSLAFDSGAWWWTAYSSAAGGRIGRRTSGGAMEFSEPLDTLGFDKGAAGIARDGSGRIWVALFGSKAVGRLTKL